MTLPWSAASATPSTASWQAIDDLLDQLARAAAEDLPAASFQRLVLERLLPSLAATHGVFWSSPAPGTARIELQAHAGTPSRAANAEWLAHRSSEVASAIAAAEPRVTTLASPQPAASAAPVCLQLVQPLRGTEVPAALEIVLPGELPEERVRTCLSILAAVAEVVTDYHSRRELHALRDARQQWRRYDEFTRLVHQSLNLDATTTTLANEARRVVGCDRVSVLVARGRSQRALAISGVDAINRRSAAVAALERLAARVAAYGEPVWYHDGVADLADEILAPLESYLEHAQSRVLALVPLCEPQPANAPTAEANRHVIGVLVAEHFQGLSAPDALRDRLAAVASHASLALHNAAVHERMPLAGLSRTLSKLAWFSQPRRLPKASAAAALALAAAAALVLVPADFDVEAKGELQPASRREVFATDDGVVSELLVHANRPVTADEPLLVLRKPELDLESQRVLGELQTVEKKLASVRAQRLHNAPASGDHPRDPHQLAAEEEQLKAAIEGLLAQQRLVEQQREALTIRSPIAGQALTWNLDQLLAARPVQRGQALLTVADLSGPWQLELHVPDDRAGYLLQAQQALGPELEVTFTLVSDPGRKFHGRITQVAPTTELDAQQQSSVRATVSFDRDQVPALRPGATAIAKIHCGRRSLGFVWLGEVYNYLRSLGW